MINTISILFRALLLDATCAPSDVAYPTDLGLLNEAREKLEHIIDVLHELQKGERQKPRIYRRKARKDYLAIAKQRKASAKKFGRLLESSYVMSSVTWQSLKISLQAVRYFY